MDEIYLGHFPGGKWSISRFVEGRWVHLVENSSLEHPGDAEAVLGALNIPAIEPNLDLYFPHLGSRGRCPTLALLELCNVLDPTNPLLKKDREGQVGV